MNLSFEENRTKCTRRFSLLELKETLEIAIVITAFCELLLAVACWIFVFPIFFFL